MKQGRARPQIHNKDPNRFLSCSRGGTRDVTGWRNAQGAAKEVIEGGGGLLTDGQN